MKLQSRLTLVWVASLVVVALALAFGLSPSPAESAVLVGFGGMLVTPQSLAALAQGFNAAFLRGFESVPSTYQQVAMVIPSTSDAENYGWMKDIPGMREWVGQRVINNLEASTAQLKNKTWEHAIGVNRDNIEDDKLGIYSNLFAMQGEIVARHPDDLVWGLLPDGFTTKGFDGQYFFDADHVSHDRDGKETSWSNTGGGSGAPWFLMDLGRAYMKPLIFQNRRKAAFRPPKIDDESVQKENTYIYAADARYNAGFGFHQLAYGAKVALDATAYEAARVKLAGQFRPDGSPLGVTGTHLVVGPSNEAKARELLEADRNASGATNVWRGTAKLIVSPWLA
ncbi:MAG: Mu-like prophage major head subunit gpT family protein [Aromatoleum sp.]|jgi:phage major head subunit gpT-like protein|uniref:Mu-like prophage major head subunit gpT family protein n=1 Tax=Aromatoleum sp. TaxID=2307007 RepID=UPI002894128F|nr:Mu-like prophage major head subunit gpT family protein [Aromatoleum sp.]MDT3669003.1 Mu-like prophage major head subunit gpT family protein [Aromatoleum sp.]